MGQIELFGGNFAPRSWMFCNGQLLSIAQFSALFSILGTTYGGDGRTTFALPDLRGRAPIGQGHGPGLSNRALGARGGAETTALNAQQIPQHNHQAVLRVSSGDSTISAATAGATKSTPGTTSGRTFTATQGYNTSTPDVTLNNQSVETGNTGNGQSFNNMEPFAAMSYIICVEGIFPSRN